MFDIGWSELAVIAVVALVVIGPKDLPKVLRTAGYWMRKVRTIAAEFQSSIEQMAREAELDELRKQVEEANKAKQALEDQLSSDAAKIAAGAANLIDDPSIMPPAALPPGEVAHGEPAAVDASLAVPPVAVDAPPAAAPAAVPEPPVAPEPAAAEPPEPAPSEATRRG